MAASVEAELNQLLRTGVEAVFAHVEAYGQARNTVMEEHLTETGAALVGLLLRCLREDRVPQPQDVAALVTAALDRAGDGIELADYLKAYRMAQISLWNRVSPLLARQNCSAAATSRTVYLMLQLEELVSSLGYEAHLENQQFRSTDHDRLRAELVEDMINGRAPMIGPRKGIVEAAGLREHAPFLLCTTSLEDNADDLTALGRVRHVVRDNLGRAVRGLVVTRPGEVVALLPASAAGMPAAVALNNAMQELDAGGIRAMTGISTSQTGWARIPVAYREACAARDAPRMDGSRVRSVAEMSALEYLTLVDDDTAIRLIHPRIRSFVEIELSGDGLLLETLEAYAVAGMSARAAADRLGIHANTVYYRLERIEERTGQDLRNFTALTNLVVGVNLLRNRRDRDQ